MTNNDFTHTNLGRTGIPVHRFGLSATNRPGRDVVRRAIDEGMNYFFAYGFDTHMLKTLKEEMKNDREKFVVATGAYNLLWGHTNLRRTLEKRLRQLNTDYIDVFLFLGVMKEKQFTERAREDLYNLREEGKIRCTAISTHDRKLAGKLASEGDIDVLMIRYNAAHRGAEEDIFTHLSEHDTGIVSYTATRWSYLLRRPKGWPEEERIPTAEMCYRFVLSNPDVHVCMTAPSNMRQFDENLEAVRRGPLDEEEMNYIKKFGDAVRHTKKWFM